MLWPLGRYWRTRPLVFSLVPRSHKPGVGFCGRTNRTDCRTESPGKPPGVTVENARDARSRSGARALCTKTAGLPPNGVQGVAGSNPAVPTE
jgi:hypothetical protein